MSCAQKSFFAASFLHLTSVSLLSLHRCDVMLHLCDVKLHLCDLRLHVFDLFVHQCDFVMHVNDFAVMQLNSIQKNHFVQEYNIILQIIAYTITTRHLSG